MAKSINSALVGILVGEGSLDIWEPVDAPEWDGPDDPRAAITLDDLLRMSSGLEWEASYSDLSETQPGFRGPRQRRVVHGHDSPALRPLWAAVRPGRTALYDAFGV